MKLKENIGHINKCQICSSSDLNLVLGLGHHAPVHAHITKEQLSEPETTYPLNLIRCCNCGLLQLDYIGDPEIIFPPEYPYQTGLTNMLIRNFEELADQVFSEYKFKDTDLIVDIGSNDGSLLKSFKKRGMTVLGVEPTNIAKIANDDEIPTIQEYFTKDTAQKIVSKYGKANIVTLTNAFAHINNLFEIMKGIEQILSDDGVFVSESQYFLAALEQTAFDTIYHEHLRFYSVKPMVKLFEMCDFSLVDAERIGAAGGSIRIYAKRGKHEMSNRAKELIEIEERSGVYNEETLKKFAESSKKAKRELLSLLLDIKKNGDDVYTIGAPARGSSFLNFTKIDNSIIDYACEKSGSPKIGLYTPGTHIPIVDEKKLFEDQPEYALILSWHIGEELMALMRKLGYKGKFIIPLPEPKVVDKI